MSNSDISFTSTSTFIKLVESLQTSHQQTRTYMYPVCCLHFVPSLHFVSGQHSAVCILYQQVSVAPIQFIFSYGYSHNTHNRPQNTCASYFDIFVFVLFRVNTLSFSKNVDITYNVSTNPPTQKNNSWMHSMLMFLFLSAVVNIPIQTLIIPPWLLFRRMIISQLELGPPLLKPMAFPSLSPWNKKKGQETSRSKLKRKSSEISIGHLNAEGAYRTINCARVN